MLQEEEELLGGEEEMVQEEEEVLVEEEEMVQEEEELQLLHLEEEVLLLEMSEEQELLLLAFGIFCLEMMELLIEHSSCRLKRRFYLAKMHHSLLYLKMAGLLICMIFFLFSLHQNKLEFMNELLVRFSS